MLKIELKWVFLFLLIVSITYGSCTIYAGDWDVFAENESEDYFLSDWRMKLKTVLEGQIENKSSPLYNFYSEGQQNISTSLNMLYQGDLRQEIGLSVDLGIDIDLSEEKVEGGINELLIPVVEKGDMIIDTGVLSANFGSSLFLNPVNYLDRYVVDPQKQGSYGFVGTKLSHFDESDYYALYYFPRFSLKDKDNNNIVLFRKNTYLTGKRFSFYFFAEEKDPWEFNNPYLGFGLDSNFSIASNYLFNGQVFYSNGETRSTVKELTVDSVPFLIPEEGSEKDLYLDLFMTINTVLFDDLDLTFGYLYNGRGLSEGEISRLLSGLELSKDKPGFNDAANSASGLLKSPYSYSEHLGLINTTIKGVFNNTTLNQLWFIDIKDRSFQVNNSLIWGLADNTEMEFNYTYRGGKDETLFGSALYSNEISFVINYYF